MTIEEIRQAKKDAEAQVLAIVQQLQKKTGMRCAVRFCEESGITMSGETFGYRVTSVRLELSLP